MIVGAGPTGHFGVAGLGLDHSLQMMAGAVSVGGGGASGKLIISSKPRATRTALPLIW